MNYSIMKIMKLQDIFSIMKDNDKMIYLVEKTYLKNKYLSIKFEINEYLVFDSKKL